MGGGCFLNYWKHLVGPPQKKGLGNACGGGHLSLQKKKSNTLLVFSLCGKRVCLGVITIGKE